MPERNPPKITFVERKYWKKDGLAFSIEKVFAEIARSLRGFSTAFVKLPHGNGFADMIRNLLFFHVPGSDVYHVTGQVHHIALRLPPSRTVLTVHDLGFLNNRTGIRRFLLKKLLLDWPVRRVAAVTCVSEATRLEILRYVPEAASKITVIENPLLSGFEPTADVGFDAACPTILQVGITPNKNIPRLLEALKGIRCRLRIVGTADDGLRAIVAGSGIDCEIVHGLSDDEMRIAYETADLVAFCSTYEGFGLPILEAQSMGKPLITSDRSPMREVSGGAAVLVDPEDTESIRSGIRRIIASAELRQDLADRGRENVKRFNPEAIAARYEEVYKRMI